MVGSPCSTLHTSQTLSSSDKAILGLLPSFYSKLKTRQLCGVFVVLICLFVCCLCRSSDILLGTCQQTSVSPDWSAWIQPRRMNPEIGLSTSHLNLLVNNLTDKLAVVVCAGTWEVKTEGSGVHGHLSKFQASLGYKRPGLYKQTNNKKSNKTKHEEYDQLVRARATES